jgi:hypothetical protein
MMTYISNHGQTIEDKLVTRLENCFDRQGLVDSDQARIWANQLGVEDYIPSWFIIRGSWMKGQLVTFPIQEFVKKYGYTTITDVWGNEHDLTKITTIISASQFKLWQSYKSMDDYLAACKKNGIGFGILQALNAPQRSQSCSHAASSRDW